MTLAARRIYLLILILSCLASSLKSYQVTEYGAKDDRIPFWIMAHMVNTPKEVHEALSYDGMLNVCLNKSTDSNGANSIEVDVNFDRKGQPTEVYHGIPCDCIRHCTYREEIQAYFQFLSQLTDPGYSGSYANNLTLVMLDLKLSNLDQKAKAAAGVNLAIILNNYIYSRGPRLVKFILAVNHVVDRPLIASFYDFVNTNNMQHLKRHIGFDVTMNDPVPEVIEMWRSLNNVTTNIWQADGITNCGSFLRDLSRLKEIARVRDAGGYFKKVYFWTVDIQSEIRHILRLGIDSVITNHPERVYEILQEPEFRDRYRKANLVDDPFQRLPMPYFTDQRKSILEPEVLKSALHDVKKSAQRYIKDFPESLTATADLILGKSIEKVAGKDTLRS